MFGGGAAAHSDTYIDPSRSLSTPTVLWWTSSASNIQAKDGASGDNWQIRPANITKAGNALMLKINYPHGLTPTITDNNSNTWPSAAVVADAGVGALVSALYVLPNANAGATTVNVAFGSNITPFSFDYGEVMNIAASSPVNGTKTATNQTGASLATGSFTPTTNTDSSGGNLILSFFDNCINAGEASPTSWSPGGSFSLLTADIAGGTGQAGYPHAGMSFVQTAQAAINPGITVAGTTTSHYNCIAVALKAAAAGHARDAGIYVKRILHGSQPNPLTSGLLVQTPASGNLWVMEINLGDTVTSITDNSDAFATSWIKEGAGGGFAGIWYREGRSPKNDLIISIDGLPGSGFSYSGRFYDIEGAAASSVLAQVKQTATGDCSNLTVVNNAPSITPVAGAVGGLCIMGLSLGQGPSYGFTAGAPAGAFFDLVNYDTQIDLSTIDNSDGSAHYYVPSTTTLNLNYLIKSITNNSFDAVAVIFKGA